MPSLLAWAYDGSYDWDEEEGRVYDGEQRAYAGDAVYDNEKGWGVLVAMDGPALMVEFEEGGEKVVLKRTASGVHVAENRDPLPVKERTGRPGQGGILELLRPKDAAPRQSTAATRQPAAKNKKGLGSTSSSSKKQKTAAPAAAAAASCAE